MTFNAEKMREKSESVSPNFKREIARAESCIKLAANRGDRLIDLGFDDVRARDAVSEYLTAQGFTVEGSHYTRPRLKVTW